jgi:hypothetical protein
MKQSPSTLKEHFALLRTSRLLIMMIAVTLVVIANAVKQSMRVHWNAMLRTSQPLATPYHDDNCNTRRHCERSEAIHACTLECYASYLATPRDSLS